MEQQMARRIIDTLAQGIHPVTGDAMPEDSPYNAPVVIRALFAASQALEPRPEGVPVKVVKPRPPTPVNAGKPWAAEDDVTLQDGFDRGEDVRALAAQLGRTAFGVEQRLIKLGKIPMPAGGGRYGTVVAQAG